MPLATDWAERLGPEGGNKVARSRGGPAQPKQVASTQQQHRPLTLKEVLAQITPLAGETDGSEPRRQAAALNGESIAEFPMGFGVALGPPWKLSGWPACFGQPPKRGEAIAPVRSGGFHTSFDHLEVGATLNFMKLPPDILAPGSEGVAVKKDL